MIDRQHCIAQYTLPQAATPGFVSPDYGTLWVLCSNWTVLSHATVLTINRRHHSMNILHEIHTRDECRRAGFGMELLVAIDQHCEGRLRALFVSESGAGLARAFMARFGDRPLWKIVEEDVRTSDYEQGGGEG